MSVKNVVVRMDIIVTRIPNASILMVHLNVNAKMDIVMLINGIVPKLMNVRQEIIRAMRMQPAQIQLGPLNASVMEVLPEMDKNVCLFVIHHVLMVVNVLPQMYVIVAEAMKALHAKKI